MKYCHINIGDFSHFSQINIKIIYNANSLLDIQWLKPYFTLLEKHFIGEDVYVSLYIICVNMTFIYQNSFSRAVDGECNSPNRC